MQQKKKQKKRKRKRKEKIYSKKTRRLNLQFRN